MTTWQPEQAQGFLPRVEAAAAVSGRPSTLLSREAYYPLRGRWRT